MEKSVEIAQQALAALPQVTTGLVELVLFISKVREAARQSAAWPPEAEEAYRASLIARADNSEFKPD